MRVVVDTNVFVSGIFWKGAPFQILEKWKNGKIHLVVSPDILSEYRRVLIELSGIRPGIDYEHAINLVNIHAEIVNPVVFARSICADPDDDKFLATAISAGASYVITGDVALLNVKKYMNVFLVTPGAFLKRM